MIRIELIFLPEILSAGQLRGHGAKVGFFFRPYEGGGFPSFEALDARHRQTVNLLIRRHVVSWAVAVSTLRAQADIVQCLRPTLTSPAMSTVARSRPLLPVCPTQPSNVGFSSSNSGSVNCLDPAALQVTAACPAKDSRLHLAGCRSDTLPPHRASSDRKFHRLDRCNSPAEQAAPG
jgi:hypothetical protein